MKNLFKYGDFVLTIMTYVDFNFQQLRGKIPNEKI